MQRDNFTCSLVRGTERVDDLLDLDPSADSDKCSVIRNTNVVQILEPDLNAVPNVFQCGMIAVFAIRYKEWNAIPAGV